ncbi:MAG: peptidylprolyl isomerase [Planctomycetota bacterium]
MLRSACLLIVTGCVALGCETDGSPTGASVSRASSGGQAAPPRGATVAYVGAQPVRLGDLRSGLLATGGGAVLGEAVLDAELADRLAAEGRAVSEADVAREREALMSTLSDDPNTAARLMRELRAARGLTDARMTALLRRNAGLRALVAGDVVVTDESVRLAYERAYGAKRVVRVAVLPTPMEAERFARDVRRGGSFAGLAIERSVDGSAGAGGLISPIGRASESVPSSVRDAAWATPVGGMTGQVAVPEGYAVVRVERELPPSGPGLAAARPDLERRLRVEREAEAMRQLAGSILRGSQVTVLDPELSASWTRYLDATAPTR